MHLNNGQVHELIEVFKGQCIHTDMEEMAREMFGEDIELTKDDFDIIDNEIFLCEGCGWWCESSEETTKEGLLERYCNDCEPEDDEE
jgi:hypothetical protein